MLLLFTRVQTNKYTFYSCVFCLPYTVVYGFGISFFHFMIRVFVYRFHRNKGHLRKLQSISTTRLIFTVDPIKGKFWKCLVWF